MRYARMRSAWLGSKTALHGRRWVGWVGHDGEEMSKKPTGGGSAARKVARAAAAGSKTATRTRKLPLGWYGGLAAVVVLGSATVAYSRYQSLHPASKVQPTVGTHWLAAVGFDVCGKMQPNLKKPSNAQVAGITTLGDGLIHIDPKNSSQAGLNATLGAFAAAYPGLVLQPGKLHLPGGKTYVNGGHCGKATARLVVETWSSLAATKGTLHTGNPTAVRLRNGELITVAFVPASAKIPPPPSRFSLVSGAGATASAAPSGSAGGGSLPSATVPPASGTPSPASGAAG